MMRFMPKHFERTHGTRGSSTRVDRDQRSMGRSLPISAPSRDDQTARMFCMFVGRAPARLLREGMDIVVNVITL